MRVTWAGVIKGRGPVAAVEGAPAAGLVEGVLVHQGEHVWRVRGVERMHSGCFGDVPAEFRQMESQQRAQKRYLAWAKKRGYHIDHVTLTVDHRGGEAWIQAEHEAALLALQNLVGGDWEIGYPYEWSDKKEYPYQSERVERAKTLLVEL